MYVWTAGHNIPGYLPESDPVAFETRAEAVSYTVSELEDRADFCAEGDDDAWAQEYGEAAILLESHDADVDGDWYDTFEDGRIAYWISCQDMTDDEAHENGVSVESCALCEAGEASEHNYEPKGA